MTPFLFFILFLFAMLWAGAISFILWAWHAQRRQQALARHFYKRLERIEALLARPAPSAAQQEAEPTLEINTNEPLARYKSVTLPDEIDINFVERK